jgi:tetratricopeptide (TPR) repeat protein
VSDQTTIYKVMNDNVGFYNAVKHRLPCWRCVVRSTCFSEIKATKRAKYLRYTLRFETPCVESVLVMDFIEIANSDLIIELEIIEAFDIEKLFETAVNYYHAGDSTFKIKAYFMFICVVHRNANYVEQDYDTAYYYLGNIFYFIFKKFDFAIELYSKGIELTTKDSSIFENRGFCFLEINDQNNALNDFRKAKAIDGGYHPDLDKIIDELENR